MNWLGMPDNLQEATPEQLVWIKEIIQEIIVVGAWPFVKSKEEILAEIDAEILRRRN